MLQIGEKIPLDVYVKDINDQKVSLSNYLGNKFVLYFYPKDNTPGCTAEACDFRNNHQILKEKGVNVVGVSADGVKSHKKFKEQHTLPFELLSDENKNLANAFGVITEKKFFGRKVRGIQRSTFLIDEKGVINKVWPKVNVEGHINEIINAL